MVYELGTIIEIGIPIEVVSRYKTNKGLTNHINNTLNQFMRNINNFKNLNIIYATRSSYEIIEINDFNYSINNLNDKNNSYIVYRCFGINFFTDSKECYDVFYSNNTCYVKTKENYKIGIHICMLGADSERGLIKYKEVKNEL